MLLVLVLLAGAGAGGWWAGREALAQPDAPSTEATTGELVWATAQETTVGRSLSLGTSLRQPVQVVAVNGLAGIVTSTSPGTVEVGDTLYAVAGVPVRAVSGETPFYRDLAREDEGADVEQLQTALVELGYLDAEPDGEFGAATESALEAWQDDLGIPETGTVPLGELVALGSLPTAVSLGESIARGKSVAGGEDAVLAPTGEQTFDVTVAEEQLRLIPPDATVLVSFEDRTWPAVISATELDENGQTSLVLSAPDGGPVCGQDCDVLPGDELVSLASEVIVVPQVTGIGAPAAAVQTRADGSAFVITESGEQDVQVRGSGSGIIILEGLDAGTRVQALGVVDGQAPPPLPPPAPAPDRDEATAPPDDGDAPTDDSTGSAPDDDGAPTDGGSTPDDGATTPPAGG